MTALATPSYHTRNTSIVVDLLLLSFFHSRRSTAFTLPVTAVYCTFCPHFCGNSAVLRRCTLPCHSCSNCCFFPLDVGELVPACVFSADGKLQTRLDLDNTSFQLGPRYVQACSIYAAVHCKTKCRDHRVDC